MRSFQPIRNALAGLLLVILVPYVFALIAVGLIATAAVGVYPHFDAPSGHTVFLTVQLRGAGQISGYVKPWIADAYNTVWSLYPAVAVSFIAIPLTMLLLKKIDDWRVDRAPPASQDAQKEKNDDPPRPI